MVKNNVYSASASRQDLTAVEAETAEALADDLADAKLQLVKLGRRVFQLS